MRLLFIFLDGIGLGSDDPDTNPLATAQMPETQRLLGGKRLIAGSAPHSGHLADLVALDANLGVPGLPQSATGQAVLLTGTNIPAEVGEHYGPKPNPAVARFLTTSVFSRLIAVHKTAALLNAFPPRYFQAIGSGHRLYSAIPLAAVNAGIRLFGKDDLYEGKALSADFTGAGWAGALGFVDAPQLGTRAAGRRMGELARRFDFSLFEYWSSDYAGHRQDMAWALRQLEAFDEVLGGLLEGWHGDDLILVTSDHGNMEDLSTRRHTNAAVPALVIGSPAARARFTPRLDDLTSVAPAILEFLSVE
jgi:hypothetical protein